MAQAQMDENEGNEWNNLLEGPLEGVIFDGVDDRQSQDAGRRNLGVDDHTPISIGDITVLFPGEAYPSQIEMMTSILRSINNQGNSLIESPTGSGKTLALLCAVLAWKTHNAEQGGVPRKIFYCTKTHSQISTVVQELKKTAYGSTWFQPRLKVAVLGSRKQHCLNDEVLASADIETSCKQLVRNYRRNMNEPARELRTCRFYRPEENDFFATAQQSQEIRDIEDLTQAGTREGTCPFYGSRRQYREADLVICPYNYIISEYIRESMRINLQDSILVFDEGHNINKALCTEASLSVRMSELRRAADRLAVLRDHLDVSAIIKDAADNLFLAIVHTLAILSGENFVASQTAILDAFNQSGLGSEGIENIQMAWKTVTDEFEAEDGPILESRAAHCIKKIIDCLSYLYDGENLACYHLYISDDFNAKKLNIICINPSISFSKISSQTDTITITSGTLTPMQTFSQELRVSFSESRSLPQSISRERYFVAKVGIYAGENFLPPLNSDNRCRESVIRRIGNTILEICRVVPNGVLCFFPSKYFVDTMMEGWVEAGEGAGERSLFDRMRQVKHVISERDMETPQATRNLLAEYRQRSRQGNGALLLGIHRGKLSEGVDFRDEEARAVINVGIPYVPLHAPEHVARRTLLGRNFWDWYMEDAFRAVNQALGRSIRHRNDWGAIIMVDPRFFGDEESALLPAWIESACRTFENFGGMTDGLQAFVEQMQGPQDT